MAKKIDSREQTIDLKKQTEELRKQSEVMRSHNDYSKSYNQSLEKGRSILKDITGLQSDQAQISKNTQSIEKNINVLFAKREKSEALINSLKISQYSNSKKLTSEAKNFSGLTNRFLKGEVELDELYRAREEFIGTDFYKTLEELIELMEESPNLSEKLSLEADAQRKINDFRDKISETSAFLSSPKAMGVAAVGLLVQQMGDFVSKAFEARQALGTTAVESARVAGNLKVAGLAAKAVGGSSEQAEAAVMSLVDVFGSVSVISAGVSKQLGLITGQFGLSGDNAGKLVKQLQAINGASIETNLNLISSVGELARAEGVAPAKVLNDIAGDTETFAKFAKDGGKNIAAAAIQAAKLGLNMATVAGIAENLLDFESSIEKQMEASVLLGRQLNLDKARELSLMGDLEGLQKEVLKQVGSEAEFNAMNVVQRKALADAIGVTVSDLGKMVAGEQTSAQAAADKVKAQQKQLELEKHIAFVTAGGAVAQIFASLAKVPFGLGLLAAGGVAAGMFGLMRSAPKAQTGGVVRETGMAVVHKGETIAGTQFGGRESNKLLKQMIEQNATLMNRLTNKVGDLALGS